MDRIRGLAPACSPASCIACCEAEGGLDMDDAVHDADLSYANWMSDVSNRLWSIPLRRIHLPGAHNSAAFKLHPYALAPAGGAHPDWVGWLNAQSPTMTTPISQLAVPWADCQGESVMDQLRHGVRYLDLRAVWVEGGSERIELGLGEGEADWLVTHTLLGGPIEDVFIQVAEFLREHQREIVLLDLQHVRAAPTAEAHAKLLGQIEKHLASLMAPPEVGTNVTYGELVQKGHQALVFYPFDTADADFPGVGIGAFARRIGCWHRGGGTLRSPWPQVGTLENLLRKLGGLCEEAGNAPGFFVLQGVVTPDAAMVAAGLLGLPNRPRCLRELAEVVTPHVEAFCCAHVGRAPCIVMVDFVSLSTIVPSLLSIYYKSLSLPRSQPHQPAIRSAWRLPADKTLLEHKGASWGNYWDPVKDMPRAHVKALEAAGTTGVASPKRGPRMGEDGVQGGAAAGAGHMVSPLGSRQGQAAAMGAPALGGGLLGAGASAGGLAGGISGTRLSAMPGGSLPGGGLQGGSLAGGGSAASLSTAALVGALSGAAAASAAAAVGATLPVSGSAAGLSGGGDPSQFSPLQGTPAAA